jgi:hypothetical protein
MKSILTKKLGLVASVAALALCAVSTANAAPIYSAVSGVVNVGGPGFGTLTETLNQSGLSSGYTSGVTNFNTYMASNPTHTLVFNGFEWFSNQGTSSARVTYNLGALRVIDAMALWNEESSGIGLLDLAYSADGINFSSLLSGLTPTNNPLNSSYTADIFSFGAVNMQYIQLDMSRCPQNDFPACSIGEVAFRGGELSNVPEPGSLALVALALAGLGIRRRVNLA